MIFILCSRDDYFIDSKPYSATEWSAIAKQLHHLDMCPKDLLTCNASTLSAFNHTALCDINRLQALLNRRFSAKNLMRKYALLGVTVVTLADSNYPQTLIENLGDKSPPVLCCLGNTDLLNIPALGMVGSRIIAEDDARFLRKIAVAATNKGYCIVSGGANGSDRVSEACVLSCNGSVVSYIAEPLFRNYNYYNNKSAIKEGRLVLVTAHAPNTKFSTPVA